MRVLVLSFEGAQKDSERLMRWTRGSGTTAGRDCDAPTTGSPVLLMLIDDDDKVERERRRGRECDAALDNVAREDRVEELDAEGLIREGTLTGRGGEEDRR